MVLTLIHIWGAEERVALKEWPNAPLTHPQSSLPPRPHPRTRSRQHWAGSPWGRRTGSHLLCSRTGHRRRAGGYGRTRPHLGQRKPVGLRKGLGPIVITTTPNVRFWRQRPGLCSGCSLLPKRQKLSCLPISGLSSCQDELRACLLPSLPQSRPFLKAPSSTRVSPKKGGRMESTLIFGERDEDSGARPSHPLTTPILLQSFITLPLCPPSHVSLLSPRQMGLQQPWTQHPHLGRGPPAHGSGSQQGRHSERSPPCCHNGLARRAVAPGHTHPHPLHTPSPGSQPGTHSGKSQAGSHRPLGRTGPGSGCTHPHLLRARDAGHTALTPPSQAPFCHPVPIIRLFIRRHSAPWSPSSCHLSSTILTLQPSSLYFLNHY